MTGDEYRDTIYHLGMSQVGSARFFGVAERTPRKWIKEDHPIPPAVAMLLAVMVHHKLSPHHVLALAHRDQALAS